MPILVSGSLVYDYIMDFPDRFKKHIHLENIHILNVCFMVEKLGKSKGGTGGNIAYNLKMLGSEPILISSVGQDGEEYSEYFKKQKIKTDYIRENKKKFTASCYITTDLDDNQITAFYNGALDTAPRVKDVEEKYAYAIIAPTQKDVMQKHLRECAQARTKIMFDPGQQITAFSDKELEECIKKSHSVIGNDYEIRALRKRLGWSEKDILKNTDMLIITFGAKGSLILTSDRQEIPIEAARPEKIVDPTGAGDAYRAGFLVGLDKGCNLRSCGRLGSVAASFAIEKYGTQEHKFSIKQFCERYKKVYREEINL